MSIIKRKELYRAGLKSWETIQELLKKAWAEDCLVCSTNHCVQYAKNVASMFAEDCPLKENPILCRKLRLAKENLGDLRNMVKYIITEIKGLHVKHWNSKIEGLRNEQKDETMPD